MTVYILLFLLGFMLAVCMLAYASIQVAELNKKAEQFSQSLKERYSKPIIGLDDKKGHDKNVANAENAANAASADKAEKIVKTEKTEHEKKS